MKKSETSKSWRELIKELETKCVEQEVLFSELTGWILSSIDKIEKRTFSYYVTWGATSDFPDSKVDINILLGKFIHGFTLFKEKKEFTSYSLSSFVHASETVSDDFVKVIYHGEMNTPVLIIQDRKNNLSKLKAFTRQVLKVWETL